MGGFIEDVVDTVSDFVGGAGDILDNQLGFDPNGGGFVPYYDAVGNAVLGVPVGTIGGASSNIAQGIDGGNLNINGLLNLGSNATGLPLNILSGSNSGQQQQGQNSFLGNVAQGGLQAFNAYQNNSKFDEISDALLSKLDAAIKAQTDQSQKAIDFQGDVTSQLPQLLSSAEKRSIGALRGEAGQALDTVNPFTRLGQDAITGLSELTRSPKKQAEFIKNNPFYEALSNDAQSRLFKNQAARGKLGSGDTVKSLNNELLKIGSDLLQREIENRQNLVNTGLQGGQLEAGLRQNLGTNLADLVNRNAQFQGSLNQRGAENIGNIYTGLGDKLSELLQQQGGVIGNKLAREVSPLNAGISGFLGGGNNQSTGGGLSGVLGNLGNITSTGGFAGGGGFNLGNIFSSGGGFNPVDIMNSDIFSSGGGGFNIGNILGSSGGSGAGIDFGGFY